MFPTYSPPDGLFGTIVWMDATGLVAILALALTVCTAGIALNREARPQVAAARRSGRRGGIGSRPAVMAPLRP